MNKPTVRAKFRCNEIARGQTTKWEKVDGKDVAKTVEIRTIKMSPVYGNQDPSHENTKFWQASPSGSLELGCVNLEAAEAFELGKEYYLDFTPAE